MRCAGLCEAVQRVERAYGDQGWTGDVPEQASKARGIELAVFKRNKAKHGLMSLPRRRVAERSCAYTQTLAGFDCLASAYDNALP